MSGPVIEDRRKMRTRQWPLWRQCVLAVGIGLLVYGLGLYPPVFTAAWWMFLAGMALLLLAVSYLDDRRSRARVPHGTAVPTDNRSQQIRE